MKIGVDMHHGFINEDVPVEQALERAKAEGFEGIYYKSPLSISSSLDMGELKSAIDCANDMGLYIDLGIGRVNPFNTNETPDVWLLGGGDYKLAIEKMLFAAAHMGVKELVGVTAGWKEMHSGYHVYDRFRTDVTWQDQLMATTKFLKSLVPVLKETGTRINLETHEEITSYEILRIIEEVGEDVIGVTFDTANVVARGEDPVAVAERTAPYVHQVHAKDCILYFSDTGLVRQVKPPGQGIVDFEKIIKILNQHQPNLHLQVEDHKGLMHCDIFVQEWRDSHPDLNIGEVAELVKMARICEQRIQQNIYPDPHEYEKPSYYDQRNERLEHAREHLFGLLHELGKKKN
ncbi:sugar phosphate isomerase/epimerase family protein [Lederbergia panacisoli]|uniref:sugar phosphate isomerase/epimerase family protein n=1 Tax=Lederbergia panacisoli TaxID=1255251 RepID=UPI00214ACF4E|nr:sugar phosphate isomerase/epimerase [Lederbergia panacisoli]MCR2823297.1 sugar phosphate isomerase/epimerase [Lederbergia panacisoli]